MVAVGYYISCLFLLSDVQLFVCMFRDGQKNLHSVTRMHVMKVGCVVIKWGKESVWRGLNQYMGYSGAAGGRQICLKLIPSLQATDYDFSCAIGRPREMAKAMVLKRRNSIERL
mgnify:CR=1 FL=1